MLLENIGDLSKKTPEDKKKLVDIYKNFIDRDQTYIQLLRGDVESIVGFITVDKILLGFRSRIAFPSNREISILSGTQQTAVKTNWSPDRPYRPDQLPLPINFQNFNNNNEQSLDWKYIMKKVANRRDFWHFYIADRNIESFTRKLLEEKNPQYERFLNEYDNNINIRSVISAAIAIYSDEVANTFKETSKQK